MSETNSTDPAAAAKPQKPRADFPLGPHPSGYWCKKIRGRVHYFGPRWHDAAGGAAAADAALNEYEEKKDALHAGRKPREDTDGLTVKELVNQFLNAKAELRDNGELSGLMWLDYKTATDCLVTSFGKGRLVADLDPDDFAALRKKLAKRWGFHRLSKTIQCVRSVFKYAYDEELVDRPVRFGSGFKRPSKKTMRLHRNAAGPKLFTAEEVRRLIGAAAQPLKAMILLGINCGYGNTDCGQLKRSDVDLDAGVIDYPRPKTGLARRCVLWTETVEALREALARRPKPKNHEDELLAFITRYGAPWSAGSGADDKHQRSGPVPHTFAKLLHNLSINGRRGLGFYALRHTFRTVADEARDQPAADYIMGHESPHMSTVYRERISDERLKAVTDYVRAWLFAEPKGAATLAEVVNAAPAGE
jgi:integrase